MERWIGEQPLLRDWLDGATPLTKPAGRAPVTRRARAGFAPGAVLLGDAARATDPLTAGGIAHALVTAERLAAIVPRALAEGDAPLARFDRERRRLLRAHDWLTRALVFLVDRPALARPTMRGMRAAPRLMRALLGIGGGVGIQPPVSRSASVTAATSAAPRCRSAARPTRTRRCPSAPDRRSRRERRAPPARSRSAPAPSGAIATRAGSAPAAASSGNAPNPAIVSAAYMPRAGRRAQPHDQRALAGDRVARRVGQLDRQQHRELQHARQQARREDARASSPACK